MNLLRIIINVTIPILTLFLIFATWMGYIAENIRDYYNVKWAGIALLLAGYIIQFYNRTLGFIVVILGIVIWFSL